MTTPLGAHGETCHPTFAIVIPTYGRTDSLVKLLASIQAQEVAPSEVVIVDQNSPGLLDPIVAQFHRLPIKHLRHAQPNASAARNLGFSASAAAYVGFLDDDMELSPGYVRRTLDCFAKCPAARCIGSQLQSAGQPINAKHLISRPVEVTQMTQLPSAGGIAFEHAYFRATGGFDELFFQAAGVGEDKELFLRMSRRGMKVFACADIIVFHDRTVPGGCGIRTLPYHEIRRRVAWRTAFISRLMNPATFALDLYDVWVVAVAVFLRPMGRSGSWRHVLRAPLWHFQLMNSVIVETREFIRRHADRYCDLTSTNHLDGAASRDRPAGVQRNRSTTSIEEPSSTGSCGNTVSTGV